MNIIASPEQENIFDISFDSRFLMISAKILKYLSMSMGYFSAITQVIRTWSPKPWYWFILVHVLCVNDIFSDTSNQIFLIRSVKLPQKSQKVIIHSKFLFLDNCFSCSGWSQLTLAKKLSYILLQMQPPYRLENGFTYIFVLTGEHERWSHIKMLFTYVLYRYLLTLLSNWQIWYQHFFDSNTL